MRILIDVGHPAHVHFFKNLIWELRKTGHIVKITAVEKENTLDLLKKYNLDCELLGKYDTPLKKMVSLIIANYKLLRIAGFFKPDLLIGWGSPYICHVSTALRKKSVLILDNEPAIAHKICIPFASMICTSISYQKDYGKKHFRYNSFEPIAYLHPLYFKPDNRILKEIGINDEKFILIRMSAWDAIHDIGQKGFNFSDDEKFLNFITELEQYGKVFISFEGEVPEKFQKYQLKISPEKYHNILAFAALYIGEGASTAVEAVILGTPSIFVSSISLGFVNELHYEYNALDICNNYLEAKEIALEKLNDPKCREKQELIKQKIFDDKINMTQWLLNLIEKLNV